jgi:hypothetical protein
VRAVTIGITARGTPEGIDLQDAAGERGVRGRGIAQVKAGVTNGQHLALTAQVGLCVNDVGTEDLDRRVVPEAFLEHRFDVPNAVDGSERSEPLPGRAEPEFAARDLQRVDVQSGGAGYARICARLRAL